ncbi:unnamed protein product [Thlaspi arvense]|uniref:Legume lectin domain-containing protein n=1 Tax=Thlaspi arvense TaxID=13288 RepID=A0AAU9SGH7_THLAR|nr:unnamed protein product [Thlaspi arvense]
MSRELKVLQIILVLLVTLSLSTTYSNGKLIPKGAAVFDSSGFAILTNTTKHSYGQLVNHEPFYMKDVNFSIDFLFGIVPEHNHSASHGMAFVLSPTRHLPGASSGQYLGLFNETNNGNASNNLIAIELDIHKDQEFGDIDDNHVGININGLRSVLSAPAGYYDDKDGSFKNLSLISGKVLRISIVYSLVDKQLNVTLCPAEFSVPPLKPLLSLNRDLSSLLLEDMYYGFTASTGSTGALHYMLAVFSTDNPENPLWDLNAIPVLPPYPKKPSHTARTVLVVCLTLSVIAAFVASWIGSVFYLRHKKVKEVLEEWEIQYGPHRFAYKELFNATKGFKEKQLLGNGGFGQVYRGTLPEFLRTGRATTSTDVYAFGLVMLEVVCGRRLIERRAAENEEFLVDWILELWENGKIFDAAEESIRQEQHRGEIELVLKLGVLCSHQAETIRPDMSAVMRMLNGVSQLPDNLLDVVTDERLRGRPEISMEVLLDMNSMSRLTFTHSFISHGR